MNKTTPAQPINSNRALYQSLYARYILGFPKVVIALMLFLVAILAFFSPKFEYDASAETLMLKNDPNLSYYRAVKARYGSDDYLLLTYTPAPGKDIFSKEVLQDIALLKQELQKIKHIEKVTSVLDVPLTKSPRISLYQLGNKVRSIENNNVDMSLVKKEFLESPIYRDFLLSKDESTTALLLELTVDKNLKNLYKQRNEILEKLLSTKLTEEDKHTLNEITKKVEALQPDKNQKLEEDIQSIREVMNRHRGNADLFLGGAPMVTSDSIEYIKNDVYIFGLVVTILLIFILGEIFRQFIWVILPSLVCLLSGISMLGLLGLLGWPVTVVSSNFLPLLLIVTLSLNVHLIVKYRELIRIGDPLDQMALVSNTVSEKFKPCFYTALTTIVAFGSLLVSGIQPLIDFGLMMTLGISISFILTFTLFPATLMLFKPIGQKEDTPEYTLKITQFFYKLVKNQSKKVFLIFFIVGVLSIIGMFFLTVENRFIDYYKKSTDVYQGMVVIDKELGGTTPLDVILDAPKDFLANNLNTSEEVISESESDTEDDDDWNLLNDISDTITSSAGIAYNSYWFNSDNLEKSRQIHEYLESLPETGKVLSIASTMEVLQSLDKSISSFNVYLSILYAVISEKIKSTLFKPYMSEDGNQLRFSVRVYESDKNLKRKPLLEKIQRDLQNKFNLEQNQVKLTGMLVLYNNVLQSFFKSQILTLSIVFLCILVMFLITFKNIKMAILALFPNIFAALFVLGLMGWFNIPLDLMTIVIAAICIGIAVDDTIHYVHRFTVEYHQCGDYWQSVKRAHSSIGLAMYYTSVIIALGFSVLIFSNFVPTIYFGLLTGCSMVIALLADMLLLPLLIVMIKPLKPLKPLSYSKTA